MYIINAINITVAIVHQAMKLYKRTSVFLVIGLLGFAAVLIGCSGQERATANIDPDDSPPGISGVGGYYPLVEGLHVTGTPVDIDIKTYRSLGDPAQAVIVTGKKSH